MSLGIITRVRDGFLLPMLFTLSGGARTPACRVATLGDAWVPHASEGAAVIRPQLARRVCRPRGHNVDTVRDNRIDVAYEDPGRLESLIRAEIAGCGPISFERFMELALYAPGLGYYVRGRDPFGAKGDFYTAEQLQPVFGILIRQFIAAVRVKMGTPADFRVVELGSGRGEMASALSEFNYTPVEAGTLLRGLITGVIFANEFFDALPVAVAVRRDGVFRNVLVTFSGSRFRFVDGPPCSGPALEYLTRYNAQADEESVIEIHMRALRWVDRIAEALDGYLLIVDYGYTSRESSRHSAGTLMSYRRHTASEDVLLDPGNRDITAHVPFTVLEDRLRQCGLTVERFETLAMFLLSVGESDQFAAALEAGDEREALKRRMQLKTLLYGMGETFRVLVSKRARH
jgi:SAM-dependent MidA family methyltransferase